MKKLLISLLMLILAVPALGADKMGASNTVILSDLMTDVYAEVAGFASASTRHKFADSTLVKNRINMACMDIANAGRIERDTTIKIVAGTEDYALPYDFNQVLWVGAKATATNLAYGMDPIPGNQVGKHRDDTGIPAFYRIDKRKIHIEPANTANDSVNVHYGAYANTLSATTDTSNIDRAYRSIVVLWAAQGILRSKLPSLGAIGPALLASIELREKQEAARLNLESKSELENLVK